MRSGSVVWNGRALIWVAAVALLVLGLAVLAAPVFAQDSVVNQNADQVGVVNDSVCSQVNNIAVQQYNAGDQNANANASANANADAGATATATADAATDANAVAAAVAEADAVNIANVLGVSVDQVNACLNGVGANDTNGKDTNALKTDGKDADDKDGDNDIVGSDEKDKFAVAAVEQYGKDDVIVASIPDKKVLVDTGGMPLSGLLIAGLFLTAAGISLFRFAGQD